MESESWPAADLKVSVQPQSRNFVNFTSLDDMASAQTRTAIASHAAKLRRQQRRKQVSLSAGEIVHDFLLWRRGDPAQGSEVEEVEGQVVPQPQPHRQSTVAVPVLRRPVRRAHSLPYNILGQGRKDPFGRFAVFEPPEIVHEVVDHAVHHFWAGFTPGSMPNPENPVVARYLEAIRQSPLAFYAYMIGTAENYELLSGISSRTKVFSQLCLSYRIEMINLINLELQSITGPPSDNLLGAIVVLAGNHVLFAGGQTRIASLDSVNASRFRSPLRTAQFIHIYSSRPFRSPHSAALLRLTAMKGGCSQIALPGVASTVALCDLVHASQTDSQLHILAMDPPSLISLVDMRAVVSSSLPTIWVQLPISPAHRPQLIEAVEALSLVTDALEWYLGGSAPSIEFSDLVSARNAAQYLLLSLMPATPYDQHPHSSQVGDPIFEVARRGLGIFSNIVLFPMNPTGGTAKILSLALKDALTWCTKAIPWQEFSEPCKRILLWSIVLGGVQADDNSECERQTRTWFLTQFVQLSSLVSVSSWEQVKEWLLGVLWSDSVLTLAAWEFWKDAREGMFDLQES